MFAESEAETLNPSKELEAACFRLQSSSSMREGSPCTLREPPQLPIGNQKRFPDNHSPAPEAGKIVKGDPNTYSQQITLLLAFVEYL